MKRSDISDLQVCLACAEWKRDRKETIELILMRQTGAPEKLVYAAMDRADDHGLTDFGVSMRTAWLTEKGQVLVDEHAQEVELP